MMNKQFALKALCSAGLMLGLRSLGLAQQSSGLSPGISAGTQAGAGAGGMAGSSSSGPKSNSTANVMMRRNNVVIRHGLTTDNASLVPGASANTGTVGTEAGGNNSRGVNSGDGQVVIANDKPTSTADSTTNTGYNARSILGWLALVAVGGVLIWYNRRQTPVSTGTAPTVRPH